MTVLIADTFFPSLARLEARYQVGAIKLLDQFHKDPRHPGIHYEKLDGMKGNVRSARITDDVRAIVVEDGSTPAFVYADHHDAVEPPKPPLFEGHADDYLVSLGVPTSWIPAVRDLRTEDQLLELCGRLDDEEVAERLFDLAHGVVVTPPRPFPEQRPIEAHPSTRRRFIRGSGLLDLLSRVDAVEFIDTGGAIERHAITSAGTDHENDVSQISPRDLQKLLQGVR